MPGGFGSSLAARIRDKYFREPSWLWLLLEIIWGGMAEVWRSYLLSDLHYNDLTLSVIETLRVLNVYLRVCPVYFAD